MEALRASEERFRTLAEAGKLELRLEAFSVRAALAEALEEIRPRAEAKKVTLHLPEGEGVGLLVADHLRVRQILGPIRSVVL